VNIKTRLMNTVKQKSIQKSQAQHAKWKKKCAEKLANDDVEHKKYVEFIKRGYKQGGPLNDYICAEMGAKVSHSEYQGKCKYSYPHHLGALMKDFTEYEIINISESKDDYRTVYKVWMKLKPEEQRFLENI